MHAALTQTKRPVSGRKQLELECGRIAAEARTLLAWTRARRVRSLPDVDGERAELEEILERAERLAARLKAEAAAGV
jgi:hypothetical protein